MILTVIASVVPLGCTTYWAEFESAGDPQLTTTAQSAHCHSAEAEARIVRIAASLANDLEMHVVDPTSSEGLLFQAVRARAGDHVAISVVRESDPDVVKILIGNLSSGHPTAFSTGLAVELARALERDSPNCAFSFKQSTKLGSLFAP